MLDDHCGKHEENTEDIAVIKGNMKLLMWLTPIAIALGASVTGYTLKTTNDSIKDVSSSVQRIENSIQSAALIAERNAAKLEYLERSEQRNHK
jgi:uncharacterized protein YoxC